MPPDHAWNPPAKLRHVCVTPPRSNLVEPFALAELHPRLRALVRRRDLDRRTVLRVGSLQLDPAR
jgi:hypothetical protein